MFRSYEASGESNNLAVWLPNRWLVVYISAVLLSVQPNLTMQTQVTCGLAGQVCCTSVTGSVTGCHAGLFCDSNNLNADNLPTCQYNCGQIGQYCCSNSYGGGCNSPNQFCQYGYGPDKGRNFCIENCGQEGQRCCRNSWCAEGLSCNSSSLLCTSCGGKCGPAPVSCGNAGQTCCSNDTCFAGLFCDSTSYPCEKTCRPYCGHVGQPCCPVKSPGYDGCNKEEGVYCDDDVNTGGTGGTGLCTPNCGREGEKCCPRGYCGKGLQCFSALCELKRDTSKCGFTNGPCCQPGDVCQLSHDCVGGTCITCGQRGQSCCKRPPNWCRPGIGCQPFGLCF